MNPNKLKDRPACPFRMAGAIANPKQANAFMGCIAEQCMLGQPIEDIDGKTVMWRCALGRYQGKRFHV